MNAADSDAMPVDDLEVLLNNTTSAAVVPEVQRLVDAAVDKFSPGISAVLFYGSCRRDMTVAGLVDLYVLVPEYAQLPWKEKWLARLIPPNVYYLEVPVSGDTLRCKCTLISIRDFAHGARRWFLPYLWGRFSQPVTIAYTASTAERARVLEALDAAVRRFVSAAVPLLPAQFTSEQLWCEGLRRSFATELRAESGARALQLYRADRDYYDQVTAAVIDGDQAGGFFVNPAAAGTRRLAPVVWGVRKLTGKLVSVVRVLKSALTFTNGLDYVVWKLERHSGVEITVPERVRRYPLIFLWPFFFDLYRRGVFR